MILPPSRSCWGSFIGLIGGVPPGAAGLNADQLLENRSKNRKLISAGRLPPLAPCRIVLCAWVIGESAIEYKPKKRAIWAASVLVQKGFHLQRKIKAYCKALQNHLALQYPRAALQIRSEIHTIAAGSKAQPLLLESVPLPCVQLGAFSEIFDIVSIALRLPFLGSYSYW